MSTKKLVLSIYFLRMSFVIPLSFNLFLVVSLSPPYRVGQIVSLGIIPVACNNLFTKIKKPMAQIVNEAVEEYLAKQDNVCALTSKDFDETPANQRNIGCYVT